MKDKELKEAVQREREERREGNGKKRAEGLLF